MDDIELDELHSVSARGLAVAACRQANRAPRSAFRRAGRRCSLWPPVHWRLARRCSGTERYRARQAGGAPIYTSAGLAWSSRGREAQMDVPKRTKHRMGVAGRQAGGFFLYLRPADPQALRLLRERAAHKKARVPVFRSSRRCCSCPHRERSPRAASSISTSTIQAVSGYTTISSCPPGHSISPIIRKPSKRPRPLRCPTQSSTSMGNSPRALEAS